MHLNKQNFAPGTLNIQSSSTKCNWAIVWIRTFDLLAALTLKISIGVNKLFFHNFLPWRLVGVEHWYVIALLSFEWIFHVTGDVSISDRRLSCWLFGISHRVYKYIHVYKYILQNLPVQVCYKNTSPFLHKEYFLWIHVIDLSDSKLKWCLPTSPQFYIKELGFP